MGILMDTLFLFLPDKIARTTPVSGCFTIAWRPVLLQLKVYPRSTLHRLAERD
jgi:hypothetical protein